MTLGLAVVESAAEWVKKTMVVPVSTSMAMVVVMTLTMNYVPATSWSMAMTVTLTKALATAGPRALRLSGSIRPGACGQF